ncbi:hypothetical protein HBI60_257750 [Parastagonospora nodorum]|nr:hypothetical protein HBI51_252570 [Parastagonospora nodorum]KAH6383333.1 hypothetical protein HBI60_257750 [Parastagonospora nodorum]
MAWRKSPYERFCCQAYNVVSPQWSSEVPKLSSSVSSDSGPETAITTAFRFNAARQILTDIPAPRTASPPTTARHASESSTRNVATVPDSGRKRFRGAQRQAHRQT